MDARGRVLLLDRPDGRPATLWPYSQVLHAAVLVAHLRGSAEPVLSFADGLRPYRLGSAFQPTRSRVPSRRYVDDNAWVGLAASQLALLSRSGRPGAATALRLLGWTSRHQVPSGGVRWREGSRGLHACSTGAVGVLALRAPHAPPQALEVARRCADFLLGPLRRPDGLVGDHVGAGGLDPTVWSYNQGLAVGLLTLLHGAGCALGPPPRPGAGAPDASSTSARTTGCGANRPASSACSVGCSCCCTRPTATRAGSPSSTATWTGCGAGPGRPDSPAPASARTTASARWTWPD